MIITHSKYEITDVFRGLVWDGKAIIGVDIDDDGWGVVVGKYYVGWKYQ